MDEKVRSSWSLKAAQAGVAPQAPSSLAVGAIAALPVLPAAFSSANAEQRREAEPEKHEAVYARDGVAAKPVETAPVVKPTDVAPALVSDAQALTQAHLRNSDVAAAEAERDAPACQAGDPAALDPNLTRSAPGTEQDRPGADPQANQDVPLPHCFIEFDPDADDGDVIALSTSPQTVQVAAQSAGARVQENVTDSSEAGTARSDSAEGEASLAQAEAGSAQGSDQATAQAPATPTAADTVLLVTEATRGVGTAVIDPLVPLDSIVFGGDTELLSLAEAPPVMPAAPDPVAEALVALGAGTQPDPFLGLGTDLVFFT